MCRQKWGPIDPPMQANGGRSFKEVEWTALNGALEATAAQRAPRRLFQTGVKLTVTETMPPSDIMLKFLMERRIEAYRPTKEVIHTHNAGALFQEFLSCMDAQHARDMVQTIEPDQVVEVGRADVISACPI